MLKDKIMRLIEESVDSADCEGTAEGLAEAIVAAVEHELGLKVVTDQVLHFKGTVAIEGNLPKLNLTALKDYLEKAVCLDIDNEEYGSGPSDDVAVTGIGINWDSLEK